MTEKAEKERVYGEYDPRNPDDRMALLIGRTITRQFKVMVFGVYGYTQDDQEFKMNYTVICKLTGKLRRDRRDQENKEMVV